ncbi:unnamed protein product [Soboliphyme baturini]|uniref:Neurotransmitter-gated ion-channel ligand-binding domain-containing protein n=1 Tax=Soboliphyme baturini TaxID=241478 RepID=A0A3P8E4G5_9BILA|nr:unnamed protein product [Soboliphyme baturini]
MFSGKPNGKVISISEFIDCEAAEFVFHQKLVVTCTGPVVIFEPFLTDKHSNFVTFVVLLRTQSTLWSNELDDVSWTYTVRLRTQITLPYNSTLSRLVRHLMTNYNKNMRPVLHPADTLKVEIQIAPHQIINVDGKRNLIEISGSFEMVLLVDFNK